MGLLLFNSYETMTIRTINYPAGLGVSFRFSKINLLVAALGETAKDASDVCNWHRGYTVHPPQQLGHKGIYIIFPYGPANDGPILA